MRDEERIERILRKIEELWHLFPDQRFGQILENYVFNGGERGDKTSVSLFYQWDSTTEKKLDALLEKNWE